MKHLTRENRYLKTERRKQLIHETCLVIFFQNISKEDLKKNLYSPPTLFMQFFLEKSFATWLQKTRKEAPKFQKLAMNYILEHAHLDITLPSRWFFRKFKCQNTPK